VALTRKQRELAEQVKYLLRVLKLSADVSEVDRELWTTHLEMARRYLVTSGVLSQYLLMDELLNDVICREFFPRERPYTQLWRTAKFKAFNYHVLERLYLVQKTEFVRARIRMSKKVYKDLLALNDLRNALAHSFFPENRRVKPGWNGADIFSRSGFDQFSDDMSEASDFFVERMRRANRGKRREMPDN
jgi:hypothetical protein